MRTPSKRARFTPLWLFVISLSSVTLTGHSVSIYDLSLSGQVHRSGFHGLAGEITSTSPAEGFKIAAKGKLTLGEDIMVVGSVRPDGIFLLQLPATQDRQWSVTLLEGDRVIAGPVGVEVTKPGVGLDWNLASTPSSANTPPDVERDAKLNRTVAREIVKAAPSFLLNITARNKPEPPMPRPPTIKILEAGGPSQREPKRLARDVERLEDERLIGLAEKLQTKEWSDRFVQKIGKAVRNTHIYATNGATGGEAVDLRISWKDGESSGSLFIRMAKLDEATMELVRTQEGAALLLRDRSRSLAPQRKERLVGYNGMYFTWGSNSGVLALWNDYHVTINLSSADAGLISQESLTGLLTLILEGM